MHTTEGRGVGSSPDRVSTRESLLLRSAGISEDTRAVSTEESGRLGQVDA